MRFNFVKTLCKSLLLLSLTTPFVVNAAIIEITGGTPADGFWDIQLTDNVKFDSISALLTSQPWWGGGRDLAEQFSEALGVSLGLPNNAQSRGPAFAYEFDTDTNFVNLVWFNPDVAGGIGVGSTRFLQNDTVWAVATPASPIPVPAAAWLFGSALLGLVGYSRRKANT